MRSMTKIRLFTGVCTVLFIYLLFPINASLNSSNQSDKNTPLSGSIIKASLNNATSTSFRIKQRNPVVNEKRRLKLTAVDINGKAVEGVSWSSGSSDIASIDSQSGEVTGNLQGFATITANFGDETASVFVVVSRVNKGKGTKVPGDSKVDNNGSLYISSPSQNVILKADKALESDLQVFAGKMKQPGYVNGNAKDALFAGPTAIAVNNNAQGGIYITDTLNHSIRKIGFNGNVETLLGNGSPGTNSFGNNGLLDFGQTTFNSPRGIAVESGGNLYVADTDNNAIYYIDFARRQVSLVAGLPGVAGKEDGTGQNARFKRPSSLALNTDGNILAVADEDNNRVRIIQIVSKDKGQFITQVSTVGSTATTFGANGLHQAALNQVAAETEIVFDKPQSIAFDGVNNIYVVDSTGVQVITNALGRTPDIISLAQPEISFNSAVNVVVRGREVFVLDSAAENDSDAVKVVTVGAPIIETVTPDTIARAIDTDLVIRGKNFAPESIVTLGDNLIDQLEVISATEIHARVPSSIIPGISTLSVLTRGGMAQREVNIVSKAVKDLANGQVTTIAGGTSFFGDGGSSFNASLSSPNKLALDAKGNLYIADILAQRVRRIDAETGVITTVVGGGSSLAENVLAVLTQINPSGLALDSAGNIFVGDNLTASVRRVDALTGLITTVAGGFNGPTSPAKGDGGLAINADLGGTPEDLLIDAAGNLFIAAGLRVRRVDAKTGIITTVAGNGSVSFSGDGALATSAGLGSVVGLTMDNSGNVTILAENRIRRINAQTGIITTIAGNGDFFGNVTSLDGRPATQVGISTGLSADATFDEKGNLYIIGYLSSRVLKVDQQTGLITTLQIAPLAEDDICAAELFLAGGVVLDGTKRLFVSERLGRVRMVDLVNGSSTKISGTNRINLRNGNGGDGDLAVKATLGTAQQVAADRKGNIYISDTSNGFIRKIDGTTGIISTIAGRGAFNCVPSGRDEGVPATDVVLRPLILAVDKVGNIFISDSNIVQRVDANSGIITRVAGGGRAEAGDKFSGDGGPAINASLGLVTGLAINDRGDLFISAVNFSSNYGVIRKVDAQTGIITKVAGNGTAFSGDGSAAISAGVFTIDLAIDREGNLILADEPFGISGRVRRIDLKTGIINTIAGDGSPLSSYTGENGPATKAKLGILRSIAADQAGNVYIGAVAFIKSVAEPGLSLRGLPRVWRVDIKTGIITVAIGSQGIYSGDGDSSDKASLVSFRDRGMLDVDIDAAGNLLIVNRDDAPISALRLVKLASSNGGNSSLMISKVDFNKPILEVLGSGFGDVAASISINGKDVTGLISSQSDTRLTLKSSRKKLNIKKSNNQIVVTNQQGAVDSFSF